MFLRPPREEAHRPGIDVAPADGLSPPLRVEHMLGFPPVEPDEGEVVDQFESARECREKELRISHGPLGFPRGIVRRAFSIPLSARSK